MMQDFSEIVFFRCLKSNRFVAGTKWQCQKSERTIGTCDNDDL
jgi:hypothetical protein